MKKITKKSTLAILSSMAMVAFLSGCSNKDVPMDEPDTTPPTTETVPPTTDTEQISKTYTLDELSQYNGTDGNKSYIAFNGKVYDVSDMTEFSETGEFFGKAGLDLSEELKASPEYEVMLNNTPIVGTLVP